MSITTEPCVPPLAAGDKLTREEFLRRWEKHPEIKGAELIGGIVYLQQRVTVAHGEMHGHLSGWLGMYSAFTPGALGSSRGTTFILDDTVQPDVSLRISHGGRSRVADGFLAGSPELLVEICEGLDAHDLGVKLDLYQAAQIPEYLAILLYEQEIRWHVLTDGKYQLMPPDADGVYRSRVFPCLWLDGKALLAGDMPRVLAKVQEGLQSPEHQSFVEELAKARK